MEKAEKVGEKGAGSSGEKRDKGENVLSFGSMSLIGSLPEFSGIRETVTVREFVDKILQAKSLVSAWDDGVALTVAKLKITGPTREFIAANEQTTPYKTLEELSKVLIKQFSVPEDLSTLHVELSRMSQLPTESVRSWGARIKGIGAKLLRVSGKMDTAFLQNLLKVRRRSEKRGFIENRCSHFKEAKGNARTEDHKGDLNGIVNIRNFKETFSEFNKQRRPLSLAGDAEDLDTSAGTVIRKKRREAVLDVDNKDTSPEIVQDDKRRLVAVVVHVNRIKRYHMETFPYQPVEERDEGNWEQIEEDTDEIIDSPLFPYPTSDEETELSVEEEGTSETEEADTPVVVKEGDDTERTARLPMASMRPTRKPSLKKTWVLRSKGPVPEEDWIPPPERAKVKATKRVTFAPDTLSVVTESIPKDVISAEKGTISGHSMLDKLLQLAEMNNFIAYMCVLWQITTLKPIMSIAEWGSGDILEIQKGEGALFLKKGSVLMSGDTWILTFDLTFEPYRWTAQTIIEETTKFITLNTAAQRRLSPYLITPNQLFQTLQNISLKLPTDRTLAVPLSPDSIFIYYHWADLRTMAVANQLRMFLTIPLKTFDRSYNLFQSIPIPMRIQGTPLAMIWNPKADFLAISNDR
ncbi:unnamed protein product [Darwinula stevensoni]|uniref:Uncharacterized protein n=1 Tax=Darwinula stevensoni TaxID=69355 RepID=A0A7R9A0K1_9CRUS|nr:unnamed protein product [Darwinula stevensoni]CAG0885726.1 unnamed protein product [Darwinula stevensoni]